MARCGRRFVLLADGGVRSIWDCGAHKDFHDETAIDVDVLADHLPPQHHHKHHLHHHKEQA